MRRSPLGGLAGDLFQAGWDGARRGALLQLHTLQRVVRQPASLPTSAPRLGGLVGQRQWLRLPGTGSAGGRVSKKLFFKTNSRLSNLME